jgi:hypothetical protein
LGDDGRWRWHFFTSVDERVCPICSGASQTVNNLASDEQILPAGTVPADYSQHFDTTPVVGLIHPPETVISPAIGQLPDWMLKKQVQSSITAPQSTPIPLPPVGSVFNGREIAYREVDGWDEQHFGKWEKSLSPSESDALYRYSNTMYEGINWSLRNNDPGQLHLYRHDISRLESAIDRARVPEDIIVFRGGKAIKNADGMRLTFEQTKKLEGQIVKDNGFISTAFDRNWVIEAFVKQSKPGVDGIIYELQVKRGTRAACLGERIAAHGEEAELLIQRGSSIKILKVSSVKTAEGHTMTYIIGEIIQ